MSINLERNHRILVTGGTGFVGKEIVLRLRKLGHPVRILARNAGLHKEWFREHGVEFFKGDISRAETLRGCCEGVTTVIHLVGILFPARGNTYESAHVEATRNILTEAKRAGVTRYIHMSAIGTRPNAASRYHQTKWEAEELVRNSGLGWTIFRPSLIYGRDDQFVGLFVRMLTFPWNLFNSFTLPCFGDGNVIFKPIGVDEVADCFVKSVDLTATKFQTIDLIGHGIPFRTLLEDIARAIGKKPVFIEGHPLALLFKVPFAVVFKTHPVLFPVPFPIVMALAKIRPYIHGFDWLLGPPICGETVKMLKEDHGGNPQPAEEYFGLHPRTFAEGLASFLSPKDN